MSSPVNGFQDWDGWEGGIWEKTPDGSTSNKPHVDYRNSPNMNSWDHWMYSHAPSRIIYDISDKGYTRFSSYLDMPSCDGEVSIEIIVYADNAVIYRSGMLRANNRNASIAFDIPESTEILTVEVDDLGRNACDHFVFGNPRLFYEIPSETQDFIGPDNSGDTINEDSVALTFSYNTADSLAPINGLEDWDGWEAGVWEKIPDGVSAPKPQPYNNFPNMNTWDHWMYSHAPSKIIYNISDRAYIRFEGYFDSPTNCGNTPSMQIIVSADNDEIYRTGRLGAGNRNTYFTFDIPASTSTLTIEVDDLGRNTCDHFMLGSPRLFYEILPDIQVDVNSDGKIDSIDLVIVASNFGAVIKGEIHPNPDVNGDGVVDREDVILVLDALDAGGTSVEDVGSAPELLASIESGEFFRQSRLLANYPNPSNPETWIPYYLLRSADVNVRIYNIDGRRVRTLLLGYQDAGFYGDRSRAAYWDGCNDVGERVASGIYFYTLSAGDFIATRKMLIRK